MEIRPALPEEYDEVGALSRRVYVDGGLIPPTARDYADVVADARGRAALGELYVAVTDDGIVGSVTYAVGGTPFAETAGPGEAGFRMLVVDPAARGGGIGAALVRFCVDRARAEGATCVRLSTAPNMTAAHRLYERLGFVRTPDLDWKPNPQVELLTYALELQ